MEQIPSVHTDLKRQDPAQRTILNLNLNLDLNLNLNMNLERTKTMFGTRHNATAHLVHTQTSNPGIAARGGSSGQAVARPMVCHHLAGNVSS